ncbi:MAG: hypothetical protein M3008_08105, partial [Chloroflexota bacterium]|nr:hypothetical protein [Chloroflexota bacterium]
MNVLTHQVSRLITRAASRRIEDIAMLSEFLLHRWTTSPTEDGNNSDAVLQIGEGFVERAIAAILAEYRMKVAID